MTPSSGGPIATSVITAAMSSDEMGWMNAGDRRTVLPSTEVPDCAMPPTNSKNCVECTIV